MSYSILQKTCPQKIVAVSDASVSVSKQNLSSASPSVFGPHYWAYLHTATMHLPEHVNPAIAEHLRNVILATPVTVPCEACSIHSGNFISANKDRIMALKTGSDFFNFTVDLHNFVNTRLGKRTVSYEEARSVWK